MVYQRGQFSLEIREGFHRVRLRAHLEEPMGLVSVFPRQRASVRTRRTNFWQRSFNLARRRISSVDGLCQQLLTPAISYYRQKTYLTSSSFQKSFSRPPSPPKFPPNMKKLFLLGSYTIWCAYRGLGSFSDIIITGGGAAVPPGAPGWKPG